MSQKLLFEPLVLRDVEIRNRIWVPPMCQYSATGRDGVATDWHLVHLGGMARGGAGAVIAEATAVVPEGRISPTDLGLWNDEQRDALAPIVAFIQSQGTTAGIQLAHAGRKANTHPPFGTDKEGSLTPEEGGWETVAPSAIAFDGLDTPREMTQADIGASVAAFAHSAELAVAAGFDMIELHGAHGYLLHEFLSPLSNHRTDGYGGSLENRTRYVIEVVDAVRARIPSGMPLLMRLSATDWTEGGLTVDDTVQIVNWLAEHGVDLIDVSSGGNAMARIPVGPGYQVPFATEIRRRTTLPVGTVGMITEPFQAEHILQTGQADVVLLGREMLRNPNFALQAAKTLRFPDAPVPVQYRGAFR